ncbi:MAG: hypothetical protein H7Z14_00475 [Anaerolineae bacterium]|nr:hypothetical protein [Phycisphaerae bacterium]
MTTNHLLKLSTGVVGAICAAWLLTISLAYCVSMNRETMEVWPLRSPTPLAASLYLLWSIVLLPAGLVFGLNHFRNRRGTLLVLIGLTIALWCNAVLLTLPYLGVYPNLITITLVKTIARQPITPTFETLTVLVLNLVIWGGLGLLAVRTKRDH